MLSERNVPHTKIRDTDNLYTRFNFQGEIGHGNFGIVVAATEKDNQKNWAIKIINKTTAAPHMTSLNREIKILKCVDHPHIIRLEKIYETRKKIYLVFERCLGVLNDMYKQKRPFTEKTAKTILQQLVDAVAYLHKYGIAHRDIKMDNILLTQYPIEKCEDYFIKLIDFGVSAIKSGAGFKCLLQDVCGTINYMAPELFTKDKYSELCDVWSMGILFYMLVFGYHPFSTKLMCDADVIRSICYEEPSYDSKTLSDDAKSVIKMMLTKNPVNRITAQELCQHPYVNDQQMDTLKGNNILNYMKEWKPEMMVPIEEDSDLLSFALFNNDTVKPSKRQ